MDALRPGSSTPGTPEENSENVGLQTDAEMPTPEFATTDDVPATVMVPLSEPQTTEAVPLEDTLTEPVTQPRRTSKRSQAPQDRYGFS